MRNLLSLRKSYSESGILISFNGPFTHSIIEEIGKAIKRYLEGEALGKGAITDVFAVYIEQTQNARNYLERRGLVGPVLGSAIVVIGYADGAYVVSSGNTILKADVPELVDRLERINALDKEGLRLFYKECLRREREPEALGAGLGLIDLARRAKGRLDYSFQPIDGERDFFSLAVTVAGG